VGPHPIRVRVALEKLVGVERCEDCGRARHEIPKREQRAQLEVHHVHYRSVDREMLEDVELLGCDCHDKRPGDGLPFDLGDLGGPVPWSLPRRLPGWLSTYEPFRAPRPDPDGSP
jgi:hypothetical protein